MILTLLETEIPKLRFEGNSASVQLSRIFKLPWARDKPGLTDARSRKIAEAKKADFLIMLLCLNWSGGRLG